MVADREAEPSPRHLEREHNFEGLSALLASAVVVIASLLVSGLAVSGWAILTTPRSPGADASDVVESWISSHSGTVEGVLLLVLPGQATFLAAAWILARRSRRGARARLGLGPPRASAGIAALCVLGTLGIQWASSLALEHVFEAPSSSMVEIWRMLSAPTGIPAVVVGLTISLVPGVCEEVLFRGLLQRGLERWIPPLVAIAIAGVAFALAHLDAQHAFGVLPIGLWLGFVAWRTDSIVLAIVCHAANNLSAIVFGRAFGDPDTGSLPETAPFTSAGIFLCLCALSAAWGLARRTPPIPESGSQMVPGGD